jgi:hypothetical protein
MALGVAGLTIAMQAAAQAGGVIGATVGRDRQAGYGEDVRRCERAPSRARTAYWDVTATSAAASIACR